VLKRFRDCRRVYAQTGNRHEFSAQFAGNTLRDYLLDNNKIPTKLDRHRIHSRKCTPASGIANFLVMSIRFICGLYGLGPILFTRAKSLGRRSPRLRLDRRWTIFRVASTDRNQISGLSTSQNRDLGAFGSAMVAREF
jgi:hypothetical protein